MKYFFPKTIIVSRRGFAVDRFASHLREWSKQNWYKVKQKHNIRHTYVHMYIKHTWNVIIDKTQGNWCRLKNLFRSQAKCEAGPETNCGATWWEISVKCSKQSCSFQSINRAHVQLCKFSEDLKRSNSLHNPYLQYKRLKSPLLVRVLLFVRCQRLIANAASRSLSTALSHSLFCSLSFYL